MHILEDVAEFHRTYNHPILPTPQIAPEQRAKLRINLITEELKELELAIANKDIVGVADALCDLQYVLSGTVLEFGLEKAFPSLFAEVQRSNMSKVCHTLEEATETVRIRAQEFACTCHYEERNGKYLIYRSEDMKTLKSINYSPANLEKIVKDHQPD